jgi:hypothetical protein
MIQFPIPATETECRTRRATASLSAWHYAICIFNHPEISFTSPIMGYVFQCSQDKHVNMKTEQTSPGFISYSFISPSNYNDETG